MTVKISIEKVNSILDVLLKTYPDAKAELDYTNPFELLIATILSAQCTDVRVNIITKELFKIAGTPEDILKLGRNRVREIIRSCGMYDTKSKNLIGTSNMLLEEFEGEVPKDIGSLIRLPGVGNKTASVVISNAFDIPAIAVDTHVLRVSNRIGLASGKNPDNVQKQLMEVIPKELWTKAHHMLIFHGRRVCSARKPDCEACPLLELCERNDVSDN